MSELQDLIAKPVGKPAEEIKDKISGQFAFEGAAARALQACAAKLSLKAGKRVAISALVRMVVTERLESLCEQLEVEVPG